MPAVALRARPHGALKCETQELRVMAEKDQVARREPSRERKREQFVASASTRQRSGFPWPTVAWVSAAAIAVVAVAYLMLRPTPDAVAGGSGPPAGPAAPVVASRSGEIRIPLVELAGGQAKFLDHAAAAGPVRFFAIRGADGVARVALDACEICFHTRLGYFQRGDEVVCRKCGNSYAPALIDERPGGCHPIRIPREVDGDHLVVLAADLERIHADHASRPPRQPRGMGR